MKTWNKGIKMGYKIEPAQLSDVFVFPKAVVEKHLKLAGASQLKVLLWLFCRNGSCDDLTEISKDTGLSPADVRDAMQYWIVNKIVCDTEKAADKTKTEETEVPSTVKEKAVKKPIRTESKKISRYEIAKRADESAEIAFLLKEAQSKLSRTLSSAEMTTLVWLHDTQGLSCEIIIMIIEYACAVGKGNIRYIESTALSWISEGIDTVSAAEKHIVELERSRQEWRKIASAFGIDRPVPSKNEQTYATRWLREWNFSMKMIKLAYDASVDHTGKMSLAYMNKVLGSWNQKGIKRPEDISEKSSSEKGKKSAEPAKSYDMDDIKKLLTT